VALGQVPYNLVPLSSHTACPMQRCCIHLTRSPLLISLFLFPLPPQPGGAPDAQAAWMPELTAETERREDLQKEAPVRSPRTRSSFKDNAPVGPSLSVIARLGGARLRVLCENRRSGENAKHARAHNVCTHAREKSCASDTATQHTHAHTHTYIQTGNTPGRNVPQRRRERISSAMATRRKRVLRLLCTPPSPGLSTPHRRCP
jgi:hypothetical protein